MSAALLVPGMACSRDEPRPATVFSTPTPGSAPPLSSRQNSTPATPVTLPPAASAPPTAAVPFGLPDPAEPGISGLARVARYVFREMRLAEADCPFTNPLHEPLSFVFHIAVVDGRMTQVHLARAGRHVGNEIETLPAAPPELTAYAACLGPRLEALVMDPPPEDGVYQPEYSYPGHPGL